MLVFSLISALFQLYPLIENGVKTTDGVQGPGYGFFAGKPCKFGLESLANRLIIH
jgi:hypothetical protein